LVLYDVGVREHSQGRR